MSTKEQQYAHLFGPFAPGKHGIGDTVTFDRGLTSGVVIWSFEEEPEEGATQKELVYVVDIDSGIPIEVKAWEVLLP